ncbi:MAG: hypothetical protein HC915_16535 [Anaerolineae bacterium]|nr:hypothetical protein [Anaerolineae bacterium]
MHFARFCLLVAIMSWVVLGVGSLGRPAQAQDDTVVLLTHDSFNISVSSAGGF